QIPGMGNATRSGTWGSVTAAIFGYLGSGVDWNGGLLAPVEVRIPPGTAVSAEVPAPLSAGSVGSAWVALSAAAACLAKLLSLHEGDGRLVPAPPDGSWSLVQVGGLNQHGEIFGTMYLDSAAWGGGAFPFRDGIDLGGTMIGPGLRFSDVEQQENNFPFLYLWRREMPDSGGAG